MAEETRQFKSKLKNGSKNFILDAIKVSSGHRIRHRGEYIENLSDNRTTEFIELQARNTNKGQDATLYIPVKNIDKLIAALQEVRPPQQQLHFGDIVEDTLDAQEKFLIERLHENSFNTIFRKEASV